eukprot:9151074-Pyramimonas_sp.AAC.1
MGLADIGRDVGSDADRLGLLVATAGLNPNLLGARRGTSTPARAMLCHGCLRLAGRHLGSSQRSRACSARPWPTSSARWPGGPMSARSASDEARGGGNDCGDDDDCDYDADDDDGDGDGDDDDDGDGL